jgi:hypothetical protein
MFLQRSSTGAAIAIVCAASAEAFLSPMGGAAPLAGVRSRRGVQAAPSMTATTGAGALREARAAKDMRYNKLGDSDLLVSEVCLGVCP